VSVRERSITGQAWLSLVPAGEGGAAGRLHSTSRAIRRFVIIYNADPVQAVWRLPRILRYGAGRPLGATLPFCTQRRGNYRKIFPRVPRGPRKLSQTARPKRRVVATLGRA